MIRVTDERDFRVRSVAGRSEEGRFELKPGRRERPRGEETAGRMSGGWGHLGDEEGRRYARYTEQDGPQFSHLNVRLSCSCDHKRPGAFKEHGACPPSVCGVIRPPPALGGAFLCFSVL